ncbi:MAG TPA: LysM peptidoglycan-binding domain-containing protein [Anaerolineae bacterium]
MPSLRALLVVVIVLATALLPAPALADSPTYIVKSGDTLNSIAAAYGISSASLAASNGLTNADLIQVSQTLALPAAAQASTSAFSAAPATASEASPAAMSPVAPAASDAASSDAVPSGGSYIVKRGDTLSGIASRYGTTTAALMRANNLKNADRIYIGMRLAIPGGTTSGGAVGGKTAKADELQPTRLMVSVDWQKCALVVNNKVTGWWSCSTGRSGWPTARGTFYVQSKIPVAYGSTWGFFMPYWLGLYNVGGLENGIHGLPYNRWGFKDWGNKIGTPISFGCIVLQDDAAKKIYDTAWVGMQVVIQ